MRAGLRHTDANARQLLTQAEPSSTRASTHTSRSSPGRADAEGQSLTCSPSAARRESVPPQAEGGRARLLTAQRHLWVLTQPVVEPTISGLRILWEINIFLAYTTVNFCFLLLPAEGTLNPPQNKMSHRHLESWQWVTPLKQRCPVGSTPAGQRQLRAVCTGSQSFWLALRKPLHLPKAPLIHEDNEIIISSS